MARRGIFKKLVIKLLIRAINLYRLSGFVIFHHIKILLFTFITSVTFAILFFLRNYIFIGAFITITAVNHCTTVNICFWCHIVLNTLLLLITWLFLLAYLLNLNLDTSKWSYGWILAIYQASVILSFIFPCDHLGPLIFLRWEGALAALRTLGEFAILGLSMSKSCFRRFLHYSNREIRAFVLV